MSAARDPVEVGIIGWGAVAGAYLRALDDLVNHGAAVLGAVCVRDRSRWAALRVERPAVRLVATAAEVLASDAQLVVILTPPSSHAMLASAAVTAGRHVLVEKPLALSADAGRAVVEAARSVGVWVLCAPFVHLSPAYARLAELIDGGAIGTVHSARAMYGNLGSDTAAWYYTGEVGPLAEAGIYNLKSLTGLLGPVESVQAVGTVGIRHRQLGGQVLTLEHPDTVQVLLRHASGTVSAVLASHAVARYRRPALEFYGDGGTAYLQGDDWDPSAIDVWRGNAEHCERHQGFQPIWNWTDGLREAVTAIRERRAPLADPEHDLHVLEIIDAARRALDEERSVAVTSRFARQME